MEADLGMIAIRLGLYLSMTALVGLAAFPFYALRPKERSEGAVLRLRRPLAFLLSSAIALSALGFAALIASMSGTSILQIDWPMSRSILLETPIGTAWLVRMGALIIALVALFVPRLAHASRLATILLAGIVALSSLVWTGHAGATEGDLGLVHKTSDMLHMIAAAVWIGGIAAFLLILQIPLDRLWGDRLTIGHRALEGFARIGTICVAVIAITGIVNSQILMGVSNVWNLFDTRYGQLLFLKLLLVGAMLLLAAKNRWRLTPDLGVALVDGEASQAVAALRKSLLLEAGAAGIILLLVAWLGTLEPAATMTVLT